MRQEIRISGFGGQGVGLAGHILGKALAIYENLEAVMTQAYGPEARGGASSANIVASDEPIDYPFVQSPDVLIALSQEAYGKFRPTAKKGAIILIDNGLVHPFEDDQPLKIPATAMAEKLGNRIVTNLVILGFFTAVVDLVSRDSMQAAITSSVKERFVDLNLRAFEVGFAYRSEEKHSMQNGVPSHE
jgi:2-oxoglutarate ferredoxin oxidoreductase subunit gamma